MEWRDQDPENCSVGRAAALVGQPWTLVVLRELFRGIARFDEIVRHLGISPPVLSRRLAELLAAGLVERAPYREPGRRERHEYHLTDAGRELFPVLAALKTWGDRHVADPEGPSTVHRHRGCGAEIVVALRCAAGHAVERWEEVEAEPGPAARPLAAARA